MSNKGLRRGVETVGLDTFDKFPSNSLVITDSVLKCQ